MVLLYSSILVCYGTAYWIMSGQIYDVGNGDHFMKAGVERTCLATDLAVVGRKEYSGMAFSGA